MFPRRDGIFQANGNVGLGVLTAISNKRRLARNLCRERFDGQRLYQNKGTALLRHAMEAGAR